MAISATRGITSFSFAIGILLFFLPFLDIKCNDVSLQKISGIELATGFRIKTPGTDNSLFGDLKEKTSMDTGVKHEKKDPNVYALAALILAMAGLLTSFIKAKVGRFARMVAGILAAGAMIGLLLDIRNDIKKEGLGEEAGITVAVVFTPWFYVALVAFLAAAFFSFQQMRTKK